MFLRNVTVRGDAGALLWGSSGRNAATLAPWWISKAPDQPWRLHATITRVDRYTVRQRPLYFTAARLGGGRWCFPVRELELGERGLTAVLEPPEQ